MSIDYGTSNTVAVIGLPDGRARPLLFAGSPVLPSGVYRDPDGRLLVGQDAAHGARLDPASFEPNPKLRIDDATVLLGAAAVPVPELIAATLRLIAAEASRVAGAEPKTVIMTYPAVWAAARRGVLREAAALAGLDTPRLVPEPVAAAAYFTAVLGHRLAPGQHLVVYDLGAGTFDVSMVRRAADGYRVVDVDGLPALGGLDLDAVVVRRAEAVMSGSQPQAWRRLTNPGDTGDRRAFRALCDDARMVKEMLSRHSAAGLFIPLVDRDIQVSREEFEADAGPRLQEAARLTADLIERTGVDRDQLAGIFLVGGSSRVPLVATTVHRAIGIAPDTLEQPETVVAEGALHTAPATAPVTPPMPAPADSGHGIAEPPRRPDQLAVNQPDRPDRGAPRPTLRPAWLLMAGTPMVATAAWLGFALSGGRLVAMTGDGLGALLPLGLAANVTLLVVAAVVLARRWPRRLSVSTAGSATLRRNLLAGGRFMLAVFGTLASFGLGLLIALLMLTLLDVDWSGFKTADDEVGFGLSLAVSVSLVAVAIWMIRKGAGISPRG